MPKAKENKSRKSRVSANPQKTVDSVVSSAILITDVKKMREEARGKLATTIIKGLFFLLGIFAFLLFILLLLQKDSASIFKDILLSFIGFSSGILISVLSFYFKDITSRDSDN